MKTNIFTLFTALTLGAGTLFAEDAKVGGIYYDFDIGRSTATVTYNSYHNEYTGDVVIPATVTYGGQTYSVTSIGDHAFYGCSGLTSVTIGNSVESIGDWAFRGCSGLTSVTIGNSVTRIEEDAFYDCSGLTSVTIPNSVKIIDGSAFYGCSLTSVVWNAKNCADFSSSPFSSSITSFTFGDEVEHIPAYLFQGMRNLTSITIPNSVKSIGSYAFMNCRGLTSVTIPNSVTSIGEGAFEDCSGLTKTYYTGNIAGWCGITFKDAYSNPMAYSHNLYINDVEVKDDLVIPDGVTSIGKYAFYGCSGLTSVTIPNFVKSIGALAFDNVPNIVYNGTATGSPWGARSVNGYIEGYLVYESEAKTRLLACYSTATGEITIPNSVTSIGSSAFNGCSGLTSVTIPNSVTSIGRSAFAYCRGLTSVTIGDSVTSIEEDAFYECRSLTKTNYTGNIAGWCGITFGNIDSNPLYYSHSLFINNEEEKDLVIPNSVTSIGKYAFYGCSGLTSVTIPNSVTSIGSSAFSGCSGLTSVTIPNSVTSIGSSAFADCSSLTSVVWNVKNCADFEYSNYAPFYDSASQSQITSFTFGDEVEHIPAYLCQNMSNLTSVTIPNSVTSIGSQAFLGCTSLTSVVWNAKNCADFSSSSIYYHYHSAITHITSFTFGNEVEHIPAYLCYKMENLTSVTIPSSVTSIGGSAFEYCCGLTKTYYTGNIAGWCGITFKDAYSNPMAYSHNLYINDVEVKDDLVIPDGVTSIGKYAFYGCSGLTSVTIPNSVKSIGAWAFDGCSGLTKITCYADEPPSISNDSFDKSTYDNASLAVPYNSWQAYKYDYYWRNFRHIGWICDTLDVNYAKATYYEEWSEAGAENFSIDFMYYNAEEDSVHAPYVSFDIYSASATAISGSYSVANATIGTDYSYVVLTDAELVAEADGFDITDATLTLAYVEQEETEDGDIVYLYDVAAEFTANGKKYAIKAQVPLRAYKGLDTNEDGYYDSWVAYELIEDATAIRTVEIDNTVYARDGRIVCEGEFRIYDLLGRDVTRLNGSLCGVYVVKSGNAAVKVVVK